MQYFRPIRLDRDKISDKASAGEYVEQQVMSCSTGADCKLV